MKRGRLRFKNGRQWRRNLGPPALTCEINLAYDDQLFHVSQSIFWGGHLLIWMDHLDGGSCCNQLFWYIYNYILTIYLQFLPDCDFLILLLMQSKVKHICQAIPLVSWANAQEATGIFLAFLKRKQNYLFRLNRQKPVSFVSVVSPQKAAFSWTDTVWLWVRNIFTVNGFHIFKIFKKKWGKLTNTNERNWK